MYGIFEENITNIFHLVPILLQESSTYRSGLQAEYLKKLSFSFHGQRGSLVQVTYTKDPRQGKVLYQT